MELSPGTPVRLMGSVVSAFVGDHLPPPMQSVIVRLPDGQTVQTNLRNLSITPVEPVEEIVETVAVGELRALAADAEEEALPVARPRKRQRPEASEAL